MLLSRLLSFYFTLFIPLLYLAILLVTMSTPDTYPQFLIPVIESLSHQYARSVNLAFAVIGMGLWLASYYHLRHCFGVLPNKPTAVVKSGPYRYLRHPMYTAIFLTFTGLSLANLSIPGFLANLLILTPINLYRAHQENKFLSY